MSDAVGFGSNVGTITGSGAGGAGSGIFAGFAGASLVGNSETLARGAGAGRGGDTGGLVCGSDFEGCGGGGLDCDSDFDAGDGFDSGRFILT